MRNNGTIYIGGRIMKPMFFYDANIFNKIGNEKLKIFIDNSYNYMTDDVAKELIKAKNKYTKNTNFNANIDLVFNENNGINSNIFLLISHVPFGMKEIIEHTENTLDLKQDPLICSFHHLWLPFIANPSLLTKQNRHYNSELTWRLSKGDLNYSDSIFQNIKNKMRLNEIKFESKFFDYSDIDISKIIRSWSKRDKDIRDKKYKITDSRLLVHALDSMFVFKRNVNILTSDYDLIDLQNTLFDCLFDQYVINNVVNKKCTLFNFEEGIHKEIIINRADFEEQTKKVIKKTEESDCYFKFIVWFYERETGKIYPFIKIIPDWLYEFLEVFRGNADCLALRNSSKSANNLKYIWYSNPHDDNIKFRVWKEEKFPDSSVVKPMLCKMCCKYEMNEINNPNGLTSFIDPEEL